MPFPRKTLLASIALLAPIVVAGIALPVDAAFAQSKKPLAAEGMAPLQSKKPLDERSAATSSGEAIDEEPSDSAADGDAGEAAEAAGPATEPSVLASAVDESFIAARKAMVSNDLERFDRAVAAIPRDHVLYDYVEYWRLRILLGPKRIEALTGEADPAVRAFIARDANPLVTDLLRRDWMLALGKRQDWPTFDEQYAQWVLKDETSPDCYAQISRVARLAPGEALDAASHAAVRDLLMRPVAMNQACADLFDAVTAAGLLKPAEIRERMLYALEANAAQDIRRAAELLGSALNEKGLQQALRRPKTALRSPQPRDLTLIAIVRLARSDADAAAEQMRTAGARLSAEDRRFAWSQIAAAGMRRLAPEAVGWAREAKGARVSDQTRAWLARAALRGGDWPMLRSVVASMSAQEQAEAGWTYWVARAHDAEGRKDAAQAGFESLSERHDFYGKLAKEALGRPIVTPPRPAPPEPGEIAAFDANAGFARALAFYALGMRFEGNREWNFQMRGLEERGLRAAAWWAQQRGLLDRAINTDERIRTAAPDFGLRFPAPFREELEPIARAYGLDPAWVYGLIRQESRFVMDARSRVGASGLMQLMPATARWVAKKLGRTGFRQSDLDDLQTNLEFGSFYLKQVMDDQDGSAVLASAGYNAGPRRSRAWRGTLDGPMEGAIFAEIIPFTETRGYVKHVLSNATDYAALFSGQAQSLTARLGTIEPKAAGSSPLP